MTSCELAGYALRVESDRRIERAVEGRDRETGEVKYTASRADLVLVLTLSCVRWRKSTPAAMPREVC